MKQHHSKLKILYLLITSMMLSITNFAFADESETKMLSCPNKSRDLIKGYKIGDAESDITIFLCNGTSVKPKKLEKQEIVSVPLVSKDQKYIGWYILENNCCTSYPIPTAIGFYNNGKTYIVNGGGQTVSNWHYSAKKDSVIIETETVHGMNEPNIDEYNIKTGKKLKHIKDGK